MVNWELRASEHLDVPLLASCVNRIGMDGDLGEEVMKEAQKSRISSAKCLLKEIRS
jgi:hypothetical protein